MISPEEFLAAQVMKGTVLVPPYPAVALRVQELVTTSSFTMSELAQLVASDPALALRVIAVANSAANRPGSGPVGSIDLAVARIGVSQVAEMALAAALAEGACSGGPLVHFRFLAWRKSLASAFLAQELASVRGQRRGEGFLIGLLWDFGLAVCLATLEPAVSAGKVASDLPPAAIMAVAEKFQREVGRRIADKWALPAPYRRALTEDGESDPGGASELGKLGRDGSRLARLVETYPAVTDKMLAGVLPLEQERHKILAFLPFLPESVAALGPQTQADGKSSPKPAPKISEPKKAASPTNSTSTNPVTSVRWLPVTIRKGTETLSGSLGDIQEGGAVLLMNKALPPNWITQITLNVDGPRPSFWVRVETSTVEGGRVRMHVVPYSFNAQTHDEWKQMMVRLRAAG
jgi:HD-like signal output (HDOD) protein